MNRVNPLIEYADLARFVSSHAHAPKAVAGFDAVPTHVPDPVCELVSRCEPSDVTAAADTVWEIVSNDDTSDRIQALNTALLVIDHPPTTTLGPESNLQWTWRAPIAPGAELHATCLLSLTQAVLTVGWDRIGTCTAADCVDMFIDTGQRAPRKYCSATCLNRSRSRAHRSRARES